MWNLMMLKLTCMLSGLILVNCEFCSYTPRPPVQVNATYGQPLWLKSEYNGVVPFLIRWNKGRIDPFTYLYTDNVLVTYVNGNNSWADRNSPRNYAAFYRQENGLTSYELRIRRVTCEQHGDLSCHFIGTNDCTTEFNITVLADPLPPFFKNQTIRAYPGQTVDVVCEANVGNPAGDIWWYSVSADGVNIRRINTGIRSNWTVVDGCRAYMTSILTVTLNNNDHNSNYRCQTVSTTSRNLGNFMAQSRVAINGLETGTCHGQVCSSSAKTVLSISAFLAHCLVVTIALVFL